MEGILQKFQDHKIQLEEITSATNNFDDQYRIGVGGYGKVYKGEVSHSKGRSIVAIKRLDRMHGQGEAEFLKEIETLSRYRHENLISLMGFCYQGDEAILVYELASRGSLDRHLNSPDLTWSTRIKICLDAAKGLSYLHDPRGTHQRLIHCDVKGGNILLDDQWNAKIADFGFSIMGPANEQQSTIITLAAGTQGYIDPLYRMTNTLTKESDVYSFGVVLFEVLCGRLCYTHNSNGHVPENLVPTWIESYNNKKLNDIIFKSPTIPPLDHSALETFSDIAYRCLQESREDRPKMVEVVTALETALESQESLEFQELEHQNFIGEWSKQYSYYEKITKSAEPPLDYKSEDELWKLLCEGVLLNGGKTWFSLNENGEHYEMISIAECLGYKTKSGYTQYKSRFPMTTYVTESWTFKTHVRSQFLSPGITYTVNLVFKFRYPTTRRSKHISLKYRLQGETENTISYMAYEREDGWWMCELYEFTADSRIVHLHILFEGLPFDCLTEVEGIEFQPSEKVDENQPISNSDDDWEEKLPTDYENIMKWSTDTIQWTTKKEAYSIIRNGFLIKNGRNRGIFFSLDKNGKKCHMRSAAHMWDRNVDDKYTRLFLPESRFGEAIKCDSWRVNINTRVQYQLVSSKTTYASYLVYKLPEDQSRFVSPVRVLDRLCRSEDYTWYFYLVSPQTPIIRPKAIPNNYNPIQRSKMKGIPQQRNDGWMEVQFWEFQTASTFDMHFELSLCGNGKLNELIVEGIEFRPMIDVERPIKNLIKQDNYSV